MHAEKCPNCDGDGDRVVTIKAVEKCLSCDGKGVVSVPDQHDLKSADGRPTNTEYRNARRPSNN